MKDTLKPILVPIHKAGHIFIVLFAMVTLGLFALDESLGFVGLVLTLWCVYFFRDPVRITPVGENLVISPADGVVQMITRAVPPAELAMGEAPLTRVSIFLNVFNVHVNRVPVAGTITALHYHPGKFFNASLDKASTDNERQSAKVTTASGKEVGFVQIAGLVARRIICTLVPNQTVKTGERYGIIRFGSRADIFLPEGVNPLVVVGQTMVGGETILADLSGNVPARTGIAQ